MASSQVTLNVQVIGLEAVRQRLEEAKAEIAAAVQAGLQQEARRIQRRVYRAFQRVTLNVMRRQLER